MLCTFAGIGCNGEGCFLPPRKPYPSDVTDEEWSLVAPYLTLMTEDAAATGSFAAGAFQRSAVCDPLWHRLARDAERPSAVVCGLSAGAALAGGGMFRDAGAGFAGFCAWRRDAMRSRRRPSSTAGPCVRRRKAARGRAMTAPNASAARSFTWPSIRSAICWRCM